MSTEEALKIDSEQVEEEETTTKYGEGNYWDTRYGEWAQDPYDWLFEWPDVAAPTAAFVAQSDRILLPGCGNAPFSPDLYDAGYTNQVNVDTSVVVIDQMNERHASRPGMNYQAGDCCNLKPEFADSSFEAIIDKSLIDTLRCCTGSAGICKEFIDEMYRLLKPQGTLIALSLNEYSYKDIFRYYDKEEYDWTVAWIHLPNPNYDPAKENTAFYTFIVCSKDRTKFPENRDLMAFVEQFEPTELAEKRVAALEQELNEDC